MSSGSAYRPGKYEGRTGAATVWTPAAEAPLDMYQGATGIEPIGAIANYAIKQYTSRVVDHATQSARSRELEDHLTQATVTLLDS